MEILERLREECVRQVGRLEGLQIALRVVGRKAGPRINADGGDDADGMMGQLGMGNLLRLGNDGGKKMKDAGVEAALEGVRKGLRKGRRAKGERTKVTEELRARIVAGHKQEVNAEALARKLGIFGFTVRRVWREAGIATGRDGKKKQQDR